MPSPFPQGCDPSCLAQRLGALAPIIGSAQELGLELGQPADALFARELVALHAAVQAAVAKRQQGQEGVQADIELHQATLVGLAALTQAYGAASPQVLASSRAAVALLRWAVKELDAAYGGELVTQFSLLGAAPGGEGVKALRSWKDKERRALLQPQRRLAADDEAAQAKRFTRNAAAFGGFLILLYGAMAAFYCMCFMPFKADSLLGLGTGKSD